MLKRTCLLNSFWKSLLLKTGILEQRNVFHSVIIDKSLVENVSGFCRNTFMWKTNGCIVSFICFTQPKIFHSERHCYRRSERIKYDKWCRTQQNGIILSILPACLFRKFLKYGIKVDLTLISGIFVTKLKTYLFTYRFLYCEKKLFTVLLDQHS